MQDHTADSIVVGSDLTGGSRKRKPFCPLACCCVQLSATKVLKSGLVGTLTNLTTRLILPAPRKRLRAWMQSLCRSTLNKTLSCRKRYARKWSSTASTIQTTFTTLGGRLQQQDARADICWQVAVDEFEPAMIGKGRISVWTSPANDPTAGVKCWRHDGRLYVEHEAGRIGWSRDDTAVHGRSIPGFCRHVVRLTAPVLNQ